jgi:autotransporter-associated beta strand protein
MIRIKLTFLCLVLVALSANVQAAVVTWTGTTGDYNVGTNWSSTPNPPATGDTAVIWNTGTATISASPSGTLANFYVGDSGGNGTVAQSAGSFTISGGLTIGRSDTIPGAVGVYNLSGGKLSLGSSTDSYFLVGDGLTSGTGTLNISGTGWLDIVAGEVFIGGLTNTYTSSTGAGSGGNGTLTMSGSGTITMTTSRSSYGYFYVGRDGATGTMTMSEHASIVKQDMNNPIVVGGGYGGAGGAGGAGTLTMSGNSSITLGTSSSTITYGEFWIGQGIGSTGTATISDSASITLNNYFCVGRDGGTGTFTMNGGTVNESGAGFCVVGSVGAATGTVIQNAGMYYDTNGMVLGEGTSTGQWHLNGGLVQASYITSGTVTIANGTGTFYFNGGTFQATASAHGSTNTTAFTQVRGSTATLTMYVQSGGAKIDTNNHDITFTAALQEDTVTPSLGGGLTKLGDGTLNLTNLNTYTGPISVNKGTLLLNYNFTQGGAVTTVATGATLGGNCVLRGVTVNTGGSLSPGKNNSGTGSYPDIGTMTLTGLTIDSANLNFWVHGPGFGNGSLIDVSAGTLTVSASSGKNLFFINTELATGETLAVGDYPLIRCLNIPGIIDQASLKTIFDLPNPYLGPYDADINIEADPTPGSLGKLIYLKLTESKNEWKGASGGNYNNLNNWVTSIPNGIGQKAMFAGLGTPPSVVLDMSPTVGLIVFNNASSYTISTSTANKFILNAGANVSAEVNDLMGSHEIAVNLTMNKETLFAVTRAEDTLKVSGIVGGVGATTTVTKSGRGTLWFSADNIYVGATTVTGGTLQLDGTNAYTGATTVTNATLIAKIIANAGSASSIGAPTSTDPSYLVLDNATFQYSGAADASTNRGITVADSVTIDSAKNLAFTGGLLLSTNLDVTLTTPGAGTITLSGPITNGETPPVFYKTGVGTLKFTANSGVTSTLAQGLYQPCFVVQNGSVIIAGTDNTTQYNVIGGELSVGSAASTWPVSTSPARLTIQGGTLNIRTWLSVGRGDTFDSTVTMTSGVINCANILMGDDGGVSGYTGKQFMNLSGNAVVNSTSVGTTDTNYVGESSGSTATLNISDTAQLNTSTYLIVGRNSGATGNVIQTGGTVTTATDLRIGQSGTGTYNLSGTGKLSTGYEYIGYSGTGTFTQTGGTNTISSSLLLGYNSGSNGTYNLNGGTLILKSLSQGSGTAAFNFGGGTLQASGNSTATLPMTLTGDGGNANIDTAGYAVTLSGVLSGLGGLNKLGSGTLTISNTATYSGNTTVNTGTLQLAGPFVNNIISSPTISVNSGATLDVTGLSGGGISLASGQTLAGSGTVAGGVVAANGSHVAPGIGTLTVGSLNMASGSIYDYQFNSTPANGLINVGGNLTIYGGGFNLYNQGSMTPFAQTGTYKMLQYSGTIGGVGASALSVLNPLPGTAYTFNTSVAHEVDLNIQPNPAKCSYTPSPLVCVPGATDRLAEWNGTSWVPIGEGSISGNVHVLVHGWAPLEGGWVSSNGNSNARIWNDPDAGVFDVFTNLAKAISAPGQTVLAYSWIDKSAVIGPWQSEANATDPSPTGVSSILAQQIEAAAGANTVNLQLIGHSDGAKVATIAATQLEESPAIHVDQLTLLDSPEATPFGIAANSLGVELGKLATAAGSKTVFVDNYISKYGHSYSGTASVNVVNVNLDPFPTDSTSAHGYPIGWYAKSALQPTPHAYNVGIDWSPLTENVGQSLSSPQWSQQWKDVLGGPDYSKELNLVPGTNPPPLPLTFARLLSDLTTLGTTYGVTGIPNGHDFKKDSPQYWDSTFTASNSDVALQFNYQFIQPGQGDQLAVWIDNELRFVATGELLGTVEQVGYFDISDLTPGTHVMTFALQDYGSAPAEFTVTNLKMILTPFDWLSGNTSASTDWNVAANWNPNKSVPNGPGTKVTFGSQAAANNVVDMISQGQTVGNITFSANTSTTIQSTGGFALTLDNNGSVSTIDVDGSHTISAQVVLNNDAIISGTGTLNLSGGITGPHDLEVANNLTATSIQVDTLTIDTGATVTIAAIPSGPLGNPISPAPEPSALVLLSIAFILAISTWAKKQKS